MAQDVSDVIQAKIKSGALPASHDGSGKSDGCDERVAQEDIEYEIDISDGRTLRFHQACFTIWQAADAKT
jgi:hypothetical protein